ncbi:MAG: hydrolase [Patescibacteria group bacterium]
MTEQSNQAECCPRFDPTPWDGKVFDWQDKRFIKDKVSTFFYMPLNFGSAMTRLNAKVEKAGAKMPDWLCLSDHVSMWKMELFLAVDKEIPDAENVVLSGKFLSKVYEGEFKDTGKWMKDFSEYAKGRNVEVKKTYMWYTTCPKCAKKYGKNYVVVVAQIVG